MDKLGEEEVRLCRCHGEPMYRNRRGELKPTWFCAVKGRERSREHQRKRWRENYLEESAKKSLFYLHVLRPRVLLEQRERVLEQLRQLEEETGP